MESMRTNLNPPVIDAVEFDPPNHLPDGGQAMSLRAGTFPHRSHRAPDETRRIHSTASMGARLLHSGERGMLAAL